MKRLGGAPRRFWGFDKKGDIAKKTERELKKKTMRHRCGPRVAFLPPMRQTINAFDCLYCAGKLSGLCFFFFFFFFFFSLFTSNGKVSLEVDTFLHEVQYKIRCKMATCTLGITFLNLPTAGGQRSL